MPLQSRYSYFWPKPKMPVRPGCWITTEWLVLYVLGLKMASCSSYSWFWENSAACPGVFPSQSTQAALQVHSRAWEKRKCTPSAYWVAQIPRRKASHRELSVCLTCWGFTHFYQLDAVIGAVCLHPPPEMWGFLYDSGGFQFSLLKYSSQSFSLCAILLFLRSEACL